jgi:hypothetical protein
VSNDHIEPTLDCSHVVCEEMPRQLPIEEIITSYQQVSEVIIDDTRERLMDRGASTSPRAPEPLRNAPDSLGRKPRPRCADSRHAQYPASLRRFPSVS